MNTVTLNGTTYDIKYKHWRIFDDDGKIKSHGGVTECFLVVKVMNKMHELIDHLLVGQAFCSTSDNFCRRTGRNIALARVITKLLTGESAVCSTDIQWLQSIKWEGLR